MGLIRRAETATLQRNSNVLANVGQLRPKPPGREMRHRAQILASRCSWAISAEASHRFGAFRRGRGAAALALHPDRVRAYGSRVQRAAERRFVQIAEAYEVLSDAERRASYDLELAEAERKGERTVLLGGGGSGGSSGARRRAEKSSPPGDSVTDVPDEFAFQPQPLGDIEFAVVDTRRIPCDSRLVDARGTDRRTGERVTVRIRVPLDARAEGARLSAACWHVCLEMSVVESASAHARAMVRCWAETALLSEEEAHGDDSGSAPA